MEYLNNILTRSGSSAWAIKQEKIRKTVVLSELILSWCRGNWISLRDTEQLPSEVTQEIHGTGWLPDERTIKSWRNYWSPERWLELKIVPVDTLLDNNDQYSIPYSGYTKGYGQDGQSSRRQKTPYSAELDGDDWVEDDSYSFTLLELEQLQRIHISLEKARQQKKQ
jgi:hypothetical protein